jgi:Tfp pilus assembly protein PilF
MDNPRSYFPRVLLALFFASAGHGPAQEISTNAITASSQLTQQNIDAVSNLLQEAYQLSDSGDLDKALRTVDAALQIDAHNASAYELRGSIYIKEKLWDRAEDDYNTALAISPTTTAFKYKLAEIKFLQKAYDEARPRFAAIVNDPGLGDLAAFKVFVCDAYSGHETRAAADLAAFNKEGKSPAYYFANALWCFTHKDPDGGKNWLVKGSDVYGAAKADFYLASLKENNSLHAPTVTFVAKNGAKFNQVGAFVEDDGLRVSSPSGRWITVPFSQLPDDLGSFPLDLRKEITTKRDVIAAATARVQLVTFSTRLGQRYEQARVMVVDDGLQVLTPDGWVTLSFDQLPEDLSPFPDDLQKQITAKRQAVAEDTPKQETLSFTSKDGKNYEQVPGLVLADGLHILTSDGWILIPFDQLPNHLSSFPTDMQKQIAEKRGVASQPEADDATLITFTAKDGKQYDQVRATILNGDLQVLTADGWVTIPFDQLPDDVSHFPAALKQHIGARRQVAKDKVANATFVSFVTKDGKHYDQVRVAAESDGLQALTDNGWITIPFDQLPDDKSAFPAELQKKIESMRQLGEAADSETAFLSFTTKAGKQFDSVRVFLDDNGLQVMTENGWVAVPFAQLPDDLSSFPEDLRRQIAEKQKPNGKVGAPSSTDHNPVATKPAEFLQP